MQLPKVKSLFVSRNASTKACVLAGSQRYRVTVICRSCEVDSLRGLLLRELSQVGVAPERIERDDEDSKHLVKIVATVDCSTVQRAALVRFVNRAGMLRGARTVRWESVPNVNAVMVH